MQTRERPQEASGGDAAHTSLLRMVLQTIRVHQSQTETHQAQGENSGGLAFDRLGYSVRAEQELLTEMIHYRRRKTSRSPVL